VVTVSNRLARSTSPYLLQHKDNPVDWYEWGEDAFAAASSRDVPVLLSVGYSACHWCHVMAHESFEDPEVAAEMNRRFVNIKVDREERPDVDSIYMEAVQAMSGRGGWPMTVWLTPDGRPFYAGTYFPPTDHHGMPSFRRVMSSLSDAWDNNREELINQSERLTEAISRTIPPAADIPSGKVLEAAYAQLVGSFDAVYGGFGDAPKFPQQPALEFLLRVRGEAWAPRADEVLGTTLTEMADGGIHDQLGGGFARYSVDRRWLVPHFEKMLYDNAQLARLYLWAGVELNNTRYTEVARSTLDYVLSDLRHPDGGFYSAEDADSEGVEGKFYVWSYEDLAAVLGDDADEAAHFFGASRQGNFEGTNVLHRPTGEPITDHIEAIAARLRESRSQRIRPGLDDKVIASWNGLAIRAFAEAGVVLEDQRYLDAATDSARFVLDHLVVEGHLMRSWREGHTSIRGFLDDHASMALGLYALYAATGEVRWYQEAKILVSSLDQFSNPAGGFYSTGSDAEPLLKRPIDLTDNPLPSGNALAAEAMLITSLYDGTSSQRRQAEGALQAVGMLAERYPSMVGHHMAVAYSMSRGTSEVAIIGAGWRDLARVFWAAFRPHTVLAPSNSPATTPPLLADRHDNGPATAYVCQGFVCELPTSDANRLLELLK
jgi:uncharacterized protein YyaL (SSP411 family)